MTLSNFNDTQNKQLVTTAIDELKLNPLTDAIPRQVIPTIQPTFELKRKVCEVLREGACLNATSATVYTTPSDKDFYLVGGQLSLLKDSTATSVLTSLSVVPDSTGTAQGCILLAGQTLTAQTLSESVVFNPPLKLKRNSNLAIANSTAVANVHARGSIWGYTEESGPQYV